MHIIYDENGNPVPHGPGHAHDHPHDAEHEHGHDHDHDHPHDAGHEHGHDHDHPHDAGHEHGYNHVHSHDHAHGDADCTGCGGCDSQATEGERMTALLDYMLQHNEHHASELDQVAEKFRAAGKEAVAEQIKKAVDEFQKGNLYLKLALSMVKEG